MFKNIFPKISLNIFIKMMKWIMPRSLCGVMFCIFGKCRIFWRKWSFPHLFVWEQGYATHIRISFDIPLKKSQGISKYELAATPFITDKLKKNWKFKILWHLNLVCVLSRSKGPSCLKSLSRQTDRPKELWTFHFKNLFKTKNQLIISICSYPAKRSFLC